MRSRRRLESYHLNTSLCLFYRDLGLTGGFWSNNNNNLQQQQKKDSVPSLADKSLREKNWNKNWKRCRFAGDEHRIPQSPVAEPIHLDGRSLVE